MPLYWAQILSPHRICDSVLYGHVYTVLNSTILNFTTKLIVKWCKISPLGIIHNYSNSINKCSSDGITREYYVEHWCLTPLAITFTSGLLQIICICLNPWLSTLCRIGSILCSKYHILCMHTDRLCWQSLGVFPAMSEQLWQFSNLILYCTWL